MLMPEIRRRAASLIHVFATERSVLARHLEDWRPRSSQRCGDLGLLAKEKREGVATDITEDVVRAVALPMGYVDIKVCAVSEIWSGLKLVIRKSER